MQAPAWETEPESAGGPFLATARQAGRQCPPGQGRGGARDAQLEGLLGDEALKHVEGRPGLVGGHHVTCSLQKEEKAAEA